MRRTTMLALAALVLVVVLLSSIFIVDEREKALVLQFGQIEQVKESPGLGFKIPLIQEVVRYDDRILSLDTDPIEVTPSDDRRLVVDAFARYRIADVVRFRQATGVGGTREAESRLAGILEDNLRAVLGADGVTSNTILSEDRAQLMARITEEARSEAEDLGLFVLDVRLKQTNLPEQNLEATFLRMEAEREREAADEIARGEEAAQRVRALADRTVVELVSEATRESEITRGEADAERNAIFADAFGADPEFFEFYRSLTAYERALREGGTTMVMSPDSEFFDYLKTDRILTGPADLFDPLEEDAPPAPPAEGGDAEADAPTGEGDAALDGAAADAPATADVPATVDAPAAENAAASPAEPAEGEAAEAEAAAPVSPDEPQDGVTVFTTADD